MGNYVLMLVSVNTNEGLNVTRLLQETLKDKRKYNYVLINQREAAMSLVMSVRYEIKNIVIP